MMMAQKFIIQLLKSIKQKLLNVVKKKSSKEHVCSIEDCGMKAEYDFSKGERGAIVKKKYGFDTKGIYKYADKIKDTANQLIILGNNLGDADKKYHKLGVHCIDVGSNLLETADNIKTCATAIFKAFEAYNQQEKPKK